LGKKKGEGVKLRCENGWRGELSLKWSIYGSRGSINGKVSGRKKRPKGQEGQTLGRKNRWETRRGSERGGDTLGRPVAQPSRLKASKHKKVRGE